LARNVADRVTSYAPPGGYAGKVWLPEIRAAIELKRDNPMRAVELLAPVTPYEAGQFDIFLALTCEVKPTLQSATARKRRWNSRK
jgi:hypothetical protein